MSFYDVLEVAMQRKGMKPQDVCEAAGLHASYISKLKSRHTKSVTWEKAIAIIHALGMTPSEFYELQLQCEQDDKAAQS